MELDFGYGETRNHELDRVDAVVSVARELADRHSRYVEDNYKPLMGLFKGLQRSANSRPTGGR
jgi:hypothetical protein